MLPASIAGTDWPAWATIMAEEHTWPGTLTAIGTIAAYTTIGGNAVWQISVITMVNMATCLISVVVWSAFGTVIGRYLGNPRLRRLFNGSMAGLLALSLVPAFW